MIDTQLGRRNLIPAHRIAVAKRYEECIRAKAKESQGTRTDLFSERRKSCNTENKTNTSKELAKLAKVGSGTMARYDVVMKSDDEELKQQVKNGETL